MRYSCSDKVMYQKILSVSAMALGFSKPALNLNVKDVISKRAATTKKPKKIRNQGLDSGKK